MAEAVGRRLQRLASGGQVLVVTHSPQVAARGHTHWKVRKGDRDGATITTVEVLDAAQRDEEIARMLSGAVVTDEARAAARALIEHPDRGRIATGGVGCEFSLYFRGFSPGPGCLDLTPDRL